MGAEAKLKKKEKGGGSSRKGYRPLTLEEYVKRTAKLLDLEKDAEKEQSLASLASKTAESIRRSVERGRVLKGLYITNVEGGLLGHSMVELSKREESASSALPAHKFHANDVVVVKPSKGDAGSDAVLQGVVYRVRETSITLACENVGDDQDLSQCVRIEKLANEVTFKRLKTTLDRLSTAYSSGTRSSSESWKMLDCVFGPSSPSFASTLGGFTDESGTAAIEDGDDLSYFSPTLDASQKEAVVHALRAQELAIVHGPPGTGKTTTVVEIVLQEAVRRRQRVLVCAASNVAVDNLVERIQRKAEEIPSLKGNKFRLVRVGHPARLLPQVLDSCLDSLVLRSDSSQLADDCVKEIKEINRKLMRLKRHERETRRKLRGELKYLNREVRTRHQKAISEVLGKAQVVACTLTGCMMKQIDRDDFDLVVVDEAAQASECATWSALLKGRRAVLCGDHLQLPPTIISEEAERKGLGVTLFERLHKKFGDAVARMLTVQYRMNEAIMKWSSDEFYESRLVAHESVADHDLGGLRGVAARLEAGGGGEEEEELSRCVLHMVDTTGCDLFERQDDEDSSYANEGEAEAVVGHIRGLLAIGVAPGEVGVITPYSAQVTLLRQLLAAGDLRDVEVSTVDGFQGREKEVIVISMVRSNEDNKVGFLADPRRMNVAVTRARRHCSLVCDSETVSNDNMLSGLVDYFMEEGEYTLAEPM